MAHFLKYVFVRPVASTKRIFWNTLRCPMYPVLAAPGCCQRMRSRLVIGKKSLSFARMRWHKWPVAKLRTSCGHRPCVMACAAFLLPQLKIFLHTYPIKKLLIGYRCLIFATLVATKYFIAIFRYFVLILRGVLCYNDAACNR